MTSYPMSSHEIVHIKLTEAHLQVLLEEPSSRIENYVDFYMDTPGLDLLKMNTFLIRRICFKTHASSYCLKFGSTISKIDDIITFNIIENEEDILAHINKVLYLNIPNLLQFEHVQYVTLNVSRYYYEANKNIYVDFSTWNIVGNSGVYGVITCRLTNGLNINKLKQLLPGYEAGLSKLLVVLSARPGVERVCDIARSRLPAYTKEYAMNFITQHAECIYNFDTSPYGKFIPERKLTWSSSDDSANCETCSDDDSDEWGPD